MSDISDYNEALIQAKLKAIRKLRELLRTCEDPTEKYRIAKALLAIKPLPVEPTAPIRGNTPAPTPVAPPTPAVPPLFRHALGTLYLNSQSLAIHADGTQPRPDAAGRLPIPLTPTGEPLQHGGPSIERPFPTPLGPQRA